MKCLFLLKEKNSYGNYSQYVKFSSGLFNSAKFVSDMLVAEGNDSTVLEVVDGNGIDKAVTTHKPKIVFIEALWVEPAKLKELMELHKEVKWVVRIHSNTPFIANEGIAMDWCLKYLRYGVIIAPNSRNSVKELKTVCHINTGNIIYLPNYYVINFMKTFPTDSDPKTLDVGCFGAIRPLKNQLIQAMAAIEYAKTSNLNLNFHVNTGRIENNGNNVLKNIRLLFENLDDKYKLVEHDWLNHSDFLTLIHQMDVGLQVSFSETFNIVTADFVSQNVPIVVSKEIEWASSLIQANPTNVHDIVKKMHRAINYEKITKLNSHNLKNWNKQSKNIWVEFVKHKK
jgi:hypothetical protein